MGKITKQALEKMDETSRELLKDSVKEDGEQSETEKERWETIRNALNTLMTSDNLTEEQRQLVSKLFCSCETKYEVEGIDSEELADVIREFEIVGEIIKLLYEIEHNCDVMETSYAYSEMIYSSTKNGITHLNEAMKGLSRYVKGMKYKPIRLG